MKRFSTLLLLLIAILWGIGFVLVKDAVSALPPFSLVAIRFIVATLVLGVSLYAHKREGLFALKAGELKAGILLGIFLYVAYSFQTIGIQYTTVSHVGFITGLSVVFVPILFLMSGKRMNSFTKLGIILCAIGIYCLSFTGASSTPILDLTIMKGDLLILLASWSVSLQIYQVGKYANRFSASKLTFIQIATCATLSCISASAIEGFGFHALHLSSKVWFELFFLGAAVTAFTFLIQCMVQKHVSPVKAALAFTGEPISSTLISVGIGLESLRVSQWFGCALMLFGVAISEIGPLLFEMRMTRYLRKFPIFQSNPKVPDSQERDIA